MKAAIHISNGLVMSVGEDINIGETEDVSIILIPVEREEEFSYPGVKFLRADGTLDVFPEEVPEPDPIIGGLSLVNDMVAIIDTSDDSAMAELITVLQVQNSLIQMMRGG